jgi:general secretion pathway protein J
MLCSPRYRQSGFTLMEVLIALTLLSLILVVLFSTLRLAGTSWDAGTARAEHNNEMRLVQNLIRRALGQAQPIVIPSPSGTTLAFSGSAAGVRFTAPLPAQAGISGLYLLGLEIQDNGTDMSLLLRRQQYRPDMLEFGEQAESTVLLEGISEASFSYLGSQGPYEPVGWTEQWEQSMRMPQLVRLRVVTDEAWPDLVVMIRNNTYSTRIGATPQIPDQLFFQR